MLEGEYDRMVTMTFVNQVDGGTLNFQFAGLCGPRGAGTVGFLSPAFGRTLYYPAELFDSLTPTDKETPILALYLLALEHRG